MKMMKAIAMLVVAIGVFLTAGATAGETSKAPSQSGNLFLNPGFEQGRRYWSAKNVAVKKGDAAQGEYYAVVTVGNDSKGGSRICQRTRQRIARRHTYTFAAFVRSAKGPVRLKLEVLAKFQVHKPPQVVASSEEFSIKEDEWKEIHFTVQVKRNGMYNTACVSCKQAGAEYQLDMVRLYEGEYAPFKKERPKHSTTTVGYRPCLFDTGKTSDRPLSSQSLAKTDDWTEVTNANVNHKFSGDAVLWNNRIAVVLRRNGPGAEIYGRGVKGLKKRALLRPTADGGSVKLASVKISSTDESETQMDASFLSGDGEVLTLGLGIRAGQGFVKTQSRKGVRKLRVEAPCRFTVLPDFFADDMMVDATEVPVDRASLPADNFFLQMVGEGDGIMMCIWNVRGEDVEIALSGKGQERVLGGSDIHYGEDGQIWVALMERPGLWTWRDIKDEDKGKEVSLEWRMPFPATWRVNYRTRRGNLLTKSQHMAVQQPDGNLLQYGWLGGSDRRIHKKYLMGYVNKEGQGVLLPGSRDKGKKARFTGPALIYPLDRARVTPLEANTVVDLVRNTLGVGPCEYILDLEGQQFKEYGQATCGARGFLNKIYKEKKQKQKRAAIEDMLRKVRVFVTGIHDRIQNYRDFAQQMDVYLEAQKKARPELSEWIGELQKVTAWIISHSKPVLEKYPREYSEKLVEEFRTTLIDYEGEDAYEKCTKITEALVAVGNSQDGIVNHLRDRTKLLRYKASIQALLDPKTADIAKEIRLRTQKAMGNAHGKECKYGRL